MHKISGLSLVRFFVIFLMHCCCSLVGVCLTLCKYSAAKQASATEGETKHKTQVERAI